MHRTPLKRYTTNWSSWWRELVARREWKEEHWLFTAYLFELLDSWVILMYYLSKLIIFIFTSFIKVDLTFNRLCTFKVYNLMFQQVDTAWNHHHSQGYEHIQHPPEFSCAPLWPWLTPSLLLTPPNPCSIISLLSVTINQFAFSRFYVNGFMQLLVKSFLTLTLGLEGSLPFIVLS